MRRLLPTLWSVLRQVGTKSAMYCTEVNSLDRLIQRIRFREASSHIPVGACLLDVGSDDGALFSYLGARIAPSVGIDPNAPTVLLAGGHHLVTGFVDDLAPELGPFDCCTALAVLEHLHDDELLALGRSLADRTTDDGILVATVPSPAVDPILDILMRLHLLDGMEAHQHHGAKVANIPKVLGQVGWALRVDRRFELGLNNLLVFDRT